MIHDNHLKAPHSYALAVFAGFLLAAPAVMAVLGTARTAKAGECAGLPPGRHALLETMTAAYGLTCSQQLKIEPLLHDEESVTKPLLRYTVLSRKQQHGMMLRIKLAARRSLLPVLTPEQRPLLERDIRSLNATGRDDFGGTHHRGKKHHAEHAVQPAAAGKHSRRGKREIAPQTPAQLLGDEAELSRAIRQYAAFTPEERSSMLLEVKRAALADHSLPITMAERAQLETEVRRLSSEASEAAGGAGGSQ